MHQIEQSLSCSSLSIIIVLDTVTHCSPVGTQWVVTVSKFDRSKPVYYHWLHQPLYNKTPDTNCWYQLTSRPALNRTKPVNLLQDTDTSGTQLNIKSTLSWDTLFVSVSFNKNLCGCLWFWCLELRTNEICLENCFIAIGCTCLLNMQIFPGWDNGCENF